MARSIRAYGPYRHGRRWRVVLVDERGSQTATSYETEREAKAVVAALRLEITSGERTIETLPRVFRIALP